MLEAYFWAKSPVMNWPKFPATGTLLTALTCLALVGTANQASASPHPTPKKETPKADSHAPLRGAGQKTEGSG